MTTIAKDLMESLTMRDALATVIPGGEWPKDRKCIGAEQPKEIGKVLVNKVHRHLVNVSIGYLFVEKMGGEDHVDLAKASKTSGPLEYYSKHAFLVRVNWSMWKSMKPEQKVALIDHELCHFGVRDGDDGEKKYVMVHHDVEEFTAIVQRWGLWRADLKKMAAVMSQRDLFDTPEEADDEPSEPTDPPPAPRAD